jgi:hypothetical protein
MPPAESPNPETKEEVVDFSKLEPINNPDCEHEFVVEDGEPDIPGTYTEVCIKPKCGVGRIVRIVK